MRRDSSTVDRCELPQEWTDDPGSFVAQYAMKVATFQDPCTADVRIWKLLLTWRTLRTKFGFLGYYLSAWSLRVHRSDFGPQGLLGQVKLESTQPLTREPHLNLIGPRSWGGVVWDQSAPVEGPNPVDRDCSELDLS